MTNPDDLLAGFLAKQDEQDERWKRAVTVAQTEMAEFKTLFAPLFLVLDRLIGMGARSQEGHPLHYECGCTIDPDRTKTHYIARFDGLQVGWSGYSKTYTTAKRGWATRLSLNFETWDKARMVRAWTPDHGGLKEAAKSIQTFNAMSEGFAIPVAEAPRLIPLIPTWLAECGITTIPR